MTVTPTDTWRCAVCGQAYEFPRLEPGVHGGPSRRGVDRRYGFWYSCWRNKACPSHKRKNHGIVLLSEVAPNPDQPDNSEALKTLELLRSSKRRRTR